MKTKSILALALTLALMLSLGVCAFADDAKFDATKAYVADMGKLEGTTCTVQPDTVEINGIVYEVVDVEYEGDLSEYKSYFKVDFSEDSSKILMIMPILKFDEAKFADVLSAVNDINTNSTTAKLYADSESNTVYAEFFLL